MVNRVTVVRIIFYPIHEKNVNFIVNYFDFKLESRYFNFFNIVKCQGLYFILGRY